MGTQEQTGNHLDPLGLDKNKITIQSKVKPEPLHELEKKL